MRKLLLTAAVVFATLMAHDAHLYPHLNIEDVAILSFLRLLLIAIPIACAATFTRVTHRWLRVVIIALALLFLPYTIYSAAEIRHVADWCHTAPGTYFTDVCANSAWTLFPTFIYALAGTWAFIFTISCLARTHVATLALIAYASFGAIFGLVSRINVWNAIRLPGDTIAALGASMNGVFWLNVALTTLFATLIYYGWRGLRVDVKTSP